MKKKMDGNGTQYHFLKKAVSQPDTSDDLKHRQTHYYRLWKTPPKWKTFL